MPRQMPPDQEDVDLCGKVVARNQEEAGRYLEQVRQKSTVEGIQVQTHLLVHPDPAAALYELVEREAIDMVALNAHGCSGNNQWPYGSLVNNFILYCKVPLLIAQDLPVRETPPVVEMELREHPHR